jgi:hypothetical protein
MLILIQIQRGKVWKKAQANRFPFILMLVVLDQKNFDNTNYISFYQFIGSEIYIGYAGVMHRLALLSFASPLLIFAEWILLL